MDNVNKYREYRSMLQRLQRHSKQMYMHQRCTEFKSNTKKLWGLINNVIKKSTKKTDLVSTLTIEGLEVHHGKQIANEFGKFFSAVGKGKTLQTKFLTLNKISHII